MSHEPNGKPLPETMKPVYANPVDIVLRQQLKHELIRALSNGSDPFKKAGVPDGAFWVFGSSIMNLHWHEGTRFPVHAKKSMDLDLGVHLPNGRLSETPRIALENAMHETLGEVYRTIGAEAYAHDGSKNPMQKLVNAGDYIIAKHFTQDDARYYLRHFKELADSIPPEGYHVALDISCNAQQPPMLLPPTEFNRLEGKPCPIRVDDTRNFLAKKLARSSLPGDFRYCKEPTEFKPRDVLDIYNVIQADPPMLDLAPDSPTSDLPLIRALFIANMAAMGKDIAKVDVAAFHPAPESMQHYRKEIDKICMPSSRFENEQMQEMFLGMEDFFRTLFPERTYSPAGSDKAGEHLVLSASEQAFVNHIQGYEALPGGHGTQQLPPVIKPDLLLTDDYFARPENQVQRDYLKQAISESGGLKERVERIHTMRSGVSF